jgi:hypothetical protein
MRGVKIMSKIFFTVQFIFVLILFIGRVQSQNTDISSVKIWEEQIVIPTYEIGEPDPNPRFYEGAVHQGAQGRVYPYPMLDVLTDKR